MYFLPDMGLLESVGSAARVVMLFQVGKIIVYLLGSREATYLICRASVCLSTSFMALSL